MSPRIKRIRKVLDLPAIKGFKPYGLESNNRKKESVTILYEEYEAMRLCDFDMYNHHNASIIMNVSRPTFTRIYASARKKVAKAFVEGRQIVIDGGKVYFDSDWYHCLACSCYFNNPFKEIPVTDCPLCGSNNIMDYEYDSNSDKAANIECEDTCICQECGYSPDQTKSGFCIDEVCPNCHLVLKRKGSSQCIDFKKT
jgi:predicted DNA-binding protein (UPF0251 family)